MLCLGAHSDDIEIGCGGTLLRLLREIPGTHVRWVVFGAHGERASEATESASRFLAESGGQGWSSSDSGTAISRTSAPRSRSTFETIKAGLRARPRLHPLPRTTSTRTTGSVSELTWNAYRNHLILEYEIPKYDGDFGAPNLFVPLERGACPGKGAQRTRMLSEPARQAVVHRGCVPLGASTPRSGDATPRTNTPKRSIAGKCDSEAAAASSTSDSSFMQCDS